MADTKLIEQQAELLAQRIEGWELNTLRHIGKRINEIGGLNLADLKAINNIAVARRDMDGIVKELAKITGRNISDIEAIYAETIERLHLQYEPLYDYIGAKFAPVSESRELRALIRSYAKTTANTFINVSNTKALGFVNSTGQFMPMEKAIHNAFGKAVQAATAGAADFHTAMRDTLKELGGSGVRVHYGSGVNRRLDTVVRQNMLYGIKQASTEYQNITGEELGCDGIEIDWHSNPRPSHAFMQGKQYAKGKGVWIKGEYYEGADEAKSPESGETVNECLDDYGCLHYATEIMLGISEPRYDKDELKRLNAENEREIEIDGVKKIGYDWKQDMRKLETAARRTKGEIEILKASDDKEGVRQQTERLKAIKTRYEEIADGSGIKTDYKRMSATKGAQNLDNSKKSGIIYIDRDTSIKLPDGGHSTLANSKITDVEVFAGKGSNRELKVKQHLVDNYGGIANNWQHTKGHGYVEVGGEQKRAMLHWFEEETVGIKEMRVKGWSKK